MRRKRIHLRLIWIGFQSEVISILVDSGWIMIGTEELRMKFWSERDASGIYRAKWRQTGKGEEEREGRTKP